MKIRNCGHVLSVIPDIPAGSNHSPRLSAHSVCNSAHRFFRYQQEEQRLRIADCADVACSCSRRCKDTMQRSSLWGMWKSGGRGEGHCDQHPRLVHAVCSTYRDRKPRSNRIGHNSNRVYHRVRLDNSRHSCYRLRSLGRCSAKDTNT